MDFQFFFDTLKRRKWLLLSASLLAGVVAFVVMSVRPKSYTSSAKVFTGIINFKGTGLSESIFITTPQIDNAFQNLTASMKSRGLMAKLSERLLLHDLSAERIEGVEPFREPNPKLLEGISEKELESYRAVLVSRADSLGTAAKTPASTGKGVKTDKLAEAYGYGFLGLVGSLDILRDGETDYIYLTFTTEDPELSYYMATEYLDLFVNDYKSGQTQTDLNDYNFYERQTADAKKRLDSVQAEINSYKGNNTVVDLESQKTSVVEQLREAEADIQAQQQTISGFRENLELINNELSVVDRGSRERREQEYVAKQRLDRVKKEYSQLQNELTTITDPKEVKLRLDEKREELEAAISQVSLLRGSDDEQVAARIQKLESQRLETEIDLQQAERAVESLQNEIYRLRSRSSALVSNESYLSQLNSELSILNQEYQGLIKELEQSQMIYNRNRSPLRVEEQPELPEDFQSRHRVIVSAFAAASTGTLLSLGFLFFSLIDNRLRTPDQMRTLFGVDPIATLTRIDPKKYSLLRLFGTDPLPAAERRWVEGVRSLRYRVEQSGKRIIEVTSLGNATGKSTVVAALATSMVRANKRVLIVDLNFKHNTLSAYTNSTDRRHPFERDFDETALPRATAWFELDRIEVIGNLGGNRSLAEVLAGTNFEGSLQGMMSEYDYVLMEVAGLNEYADGRELASYAEGVLCVVDAGQSVDTAGKESMGYLDDLGDRFLGYVLNGVELKLLT